MIARYLRALADRLEPQTAHLDHCCQSCGKERHRKDKITVLAWAHDSCEFPEGVPLPEPLASLLEGDL